MSAPATIDPVACRFMALACAPPSAERRMEMLALAEVLDGPMRADAIALAGPASGEVLEHEYHRMLGASGACRDCETDYEVNPLGGKGPLLADIAGFYRAFSYAGADHERWQPDHISAELDFLAYLGLKARVARAAGLADEAAVCDRGVEDFWDAHAGRWAPAFFERLAATAGAQAGAQDLRASDGAAGDRAGDGAGHYARVASLGRGLVGDPASRPWP